MTRTEPPDGILEAALYVDDLDAAAGFYGGVLGLEQVIRHDPRHVFYRCGPTILLLFRAEETRKPTRSAALPVPPHGADDTLDRIFAVGRLLPAALRETNSGPWAAPACTAGACLGCTTRH